jgi:Ca-activated chloride channel family protein
MTFAYPWLLCLPLLYILIKIFARGEGVPALFSSYTVLDPLPLSLRLQLRTPLLFLLSLLAVSLLALAAARPQSITVIDQPLSGRNIILVIDVSNSMRAQDFPTSLGHVSRMEGVKIVVAEYVHSRTQDRIGLVVFGHSSYLQSPLTADTALVEELVGDLAPGMAGDGTAIGDGLGLGLKLLKDIEGESKAIILMTDGVNNAGLVGPIKAAKISKDLGIRIHTIGIGVGEAPLGDQVLGGVLGLSFGPRAEFDEATLRQIATTTGGVYFNAQSLEGLKAVYHDIEKLTETEKDQPSRTLVEEKFPPFLIAALLTYLLTLLLSVTVFMKVP